MSCSPPWTDHPSRANSMDRVSEILQYSLPDGVANSYGLEAAFCFCLTAPQACNLLRRTATERIDLRLPALRKVCADIEVRYAICHVQLVTDLIVMFGEGDSRARQSIGYCFSTLLPHFPPRARRNVQLFLLQSEYIGVRRRAYKSLSVENTFHERLLRRPGPNLVITNAPNYSLKDSLPTSFLAIAKRFRPF